MNVVALTLEKKLKTIRKQTETHTFFVKKGMIKDKFVRTYVECTCDLTVPHHHLYDRVDTKLPTKKLVTLENLEK